MQNLLGQNYRMRLHSLWPPVRLRGVWRHDREQGERGDQVPFVQDAGLEAHENLRVGIWLSVSTGLFAIMLRALVILAAMAVM